MMTLIYISVYWLAMFALILISYNEGAKGQMHWKITLMLFFISVVFPIMVVYHIIRKARKHLRDM